MAYRVRRFLQSGAGTAAVEFAIVAPLFIFLILGMIAYGIYFGAAHSVQQIAADAARTAIAGLDETERQTLAQNFININGGGYVFIEADKLEVDVSDNPNDTQQFVVAVRYDAANLPIWRFLERLPLPGKSISRSSTIRIGGI